MSTKKITLKIEGMSCVACASTIEKNLLKLKEVLKVQVLLTSEKAVVEVDENFKNISLLLHTVKASGYKAALFKESPDAGNQNLKLWKFIFSALLSAPFFLQMIWHLLGYSWEIPLFIQASLATIVQFVFGWQFYEKSYHAIKNKNPTMDLLIAIGTTAAYGLSLATYLLHLNISLYFESSTMIITLVLLGKWIESKTKKATSESIEKLLLLQPKKAFVEVNGMWVEKKIQEIQKGTIFLVKPGETIPVDGLVIEGESTVNESMLTGESLPVSKSLNSKLYAATINQKGLLKGKATTTAEKTMYSKIIETIQNAQSSKAPIQNLADKVTNYFVPTVLLISLATFLIGLFFEKPDTSLIQAISVLIIACPCALGLATPTVIAVASGMGAQKGILFKEAAAIQKAGEITYLFLDKTGTLTEDKPSVKIEHFSGIEELPFLKITLSLTSNSTHPISTTIAESIRKREIDSMPISQYISHSGKGLEAVIDGTNYYLGSKKYLLEFFPNYTFSNEEKTTSFLWTKESVLGVFIVENSLVPNAKEAIEKIKNLGVKVEILSGDNYEITKKVASKLSIELFLAELMPEDKLKMIETAKSKGEIVGMVGDGINDSPALTAASVSFAIGKGSDIAIETADITLLGHPLNNVAAAIKLSRLSLKKIKQNLFFAFVFNSLGIPLAAIGMLSPIIAAAAMALSSICVIFNALILKKAKI